MANGIIYEIKQKIKRKINDIFLYVINSINIVSENINSALNKLRIKVMKSLKYNTLENDYGFEDLMPRINIENNEDYCKSLDWALKNENIKNIAITGIYGAGKSSIIKTYSSYHKEYKYLNISLASFKENENDESEVLEKSILKQMFYKVKYKKIPYSRFKKISNISSSSIILKILSVFIIICIGTVFYYPGIVNEIYNKFNVIENTLKISQTHLIFMATMFIVLVSVLLIKVFKYFSKYLKIKSIKINVMDEEAEIGEDSEKSIFNKYIDEIVYFFEATKYNVVIFEDLDRFDNIDVFSNLRDLNILLNNSEQISRRIVFVYAIKDAMFSNKDKEDIKYGKDDNNSSKNRTKFFDFIIPIIPIANSANSCDLLINKLKNFNEWDGLNDEFISDITFLINDMRILKNIYNEFIIYKRNLEVDMVNNTNNINKIDTIKLLAIIVYKNMYPSDFDKLQIDEGMVYEVFKNTKNKFIQQRITAINEQCSKIKNDIKIAQSECLNNIQELRMVCLIPLIEKSESNSIGMGQAYNQHKFSDLIENEQVFSKFLEEDNNRYYYQSAKNWYIISEKEKEEIQDKKNAYYKREKLIKLKEEHNINVVEYLKNQLEKLNDKKEIINSLPLKKILEDNNLEVTIFPEHIRNEKLIMFLIKNGCIDEDYSEYISYFYEGTLTKKDRDFLYSVKYQEKLGFGYELNKVDAVIKKISKHEFKMKYVLNYTLLDYIIKNKNIKENYNVYYDFIMEQLAKEDDFTFSFIEGYIARNKNIKEFIKDICKHWNGIWQWIENNNDISKNDKKKYIKYILEFAENKDIEKINKDSVLKKCICNMIDFLYVCNDKEYNEKIEGIIKLLNIKFKDLIILNNDVDLVSNMFGQPNVVNPYTDLNNKFFECLENNEFVDIGIHNKNLLKYIYENNFYEINPNMVEIILKQYSDKEEAYINYTGIVESNCGKLLEYINSNINEYIKNILLIHTINIMEKENSIILLINNEEVSNENKSLIIEKLRFKINDLKQVELCELWYKIIVNNKCTITWNNVIKYYEYVGNLDEILIDYLNKQEIYSELSKANLEDFLDDFDEEILKNISIQLIQCKDITDNSFEQIVKSLYYHYNRISLSKLSYERVEVMFKNNLFIFNKENYDELKENFKDIHIELIVKNIKKYCDEKEKYAIDSYDLKKLLSCKEINNQCKVDIIKYIDVGLIDNNSKLIELISQLVMQNENDENLINKLAEILIEYRLEERIMDKILKFIIQKERDIEVKIKILTSQIKYLSRKELMDNLEMIGSPYNKIIEYNKRPSISATNLNIDFIKEMKESKKINSYKIEGNKIRIINLQRKIK